MLTDHDMSELFDDARAGVAKLVDQLVKKHEPPNIGPVFQALLVGWAEAVETINCRACARNLLAEARQELYDRRHELPREHLH
jgi:hypothetical protein